MPRYKLRVPQTGDVLYGDGIAIVADTLVGRARKGRYGWRLPVRFGWPDLTGPTRPMMLGQIILNATPAWPGDTRRVTVTVAGEVVAAGVRERTAELLRDLRIARLTAEWEAEQFAAYEHAGAAA